MSQVFIGHNLVPV